jgi:hypothetical protein
MSHGGNNHYRRVAAVLAQQAEDAARRAREKADRLAIIAWNERMRAGGPAQPRHRRPAMQCRDFRNRSFAPMSRTMDSELYQLNFKLFRVFELYC